MTIAATWKRYGALIADSLLTSPYSDQIRHEDFPLIPGSADRLKELGVDGIYRNLATKIISPSPKLVLGCAGSMLHAIELTYLLEDKTPAPVIEDIEARLREVSSKHSLDLACTGVVATTEGPICFCFDFETMRFLHGKGYAVGSGMNYYNEFTKNSPIYSSTPYEDPGAVYSQVSSLMAHHYFSNEQLMVNIGGNYSTKVYKDGKFIDPPTTLHLFCSFDTDDQGKIIGSGEYFFVHQVQRDRQLLTRRMRKMPEVWTKRNNSKLDVIDVTTPFRPEKILFSLEDLTIDFSADIYFINSAVRHKGRILTSNLAYKSSHTGLPIHVHKDTSQGHQIDLDKHLPEVIVFYTLSRIYNSG